MKEDWEYFPLSSNLSLQSQSTYILTTMYVPSLEAGPPPSPYLLVTTVCLPRKQSLTLLMPAILRASSSMLFVSLFIRLEPAAWSLSNMKRYIKKIHARRKSSTTKAYLEQKLRRKGTVFILICNVSFSKSGSGPVADKCCECWIFCLGNSGSSC